MYYLDVEPRVAARYHDDTSLVASIEDAKNYLEDAHRGSDFKFTSPEAIWVRSGILNYRWAYNFTLGGHIEWQFRFGDTLPQMEGLENFIDWPSNLREGRTQFPVPLPMHFHQNSEAAHRAWFRYKIPWEQKWTRRVKPVWWNNLHPMWKEVYE